MEKRAIFTCSIPTNLGKFNANDSQVVQKENISLGGTAGAGNSRRARVLAAIGRERRPLALQLGCERRLKAYAFSGSTFAASPSAQGSGNQMYPGGILALSANGEQHGSGVLWATTTA